MGHRQRLEGPVEERTTELRRVNEQLQKEMTARKRAEEKSREKQTGWMHRRY
jgi:C4-dicarboxylate-specific signal transduction histidine kinase